MAPKKDQKEDNTYIHQTIIGNGLRAKIDMRVFIKENENTLVKNIIGVKCPKCGSDNIYAETNQLRSSDEASDRICLCLDCHTQFKISGSTDGRKPTD